jgi:WD40 repeat protein
MPPGTDARHRLIATALAETAARTLPAQPNQYVVRHLAEHVSIGGDWQILADRPRVLDALDPDAVAQQAYPDASHKVTMPLDLVGAVAGRHVLRLAAANDRGAIRAVAAARATSRMPRDRGAGLWRVVTVRMRVDPLHIVLTGHTGWIRGLAVIDVDRGQQVLAVADSDGLVKLWDMASGLPVGEPIVAHNHELTALAVVRLADGRAGLATAGERGTIRLWDATAGSPISERAGAHPGRVEAMTTVRLADGAEILATAGEFDRRVRLWQPAAPLRLIRELRVPGEVRCLAAVPTSDGGTQLAVGGTDGTVRCWNPAAGRAATGRLLRRLRLRLRLRRLRLRHPYFLESIATVTSQDGSALLVTCGSGLQSWRPDGRPVGEGFAAPADQVAATRLPEGRAALATGDWQGTVRFWDPDTRVPVGQPLTGHTARVTAMVGATLPDGRSMLATGDTDAVVRVWDPAVTGRSWPAARTEPIRAMTGVTLPDGSEVLAVTSGRWLQLWDPETGELVRELQSFHELRALAPVLRRDGSMLVAVGDADDVHLWDPATRAFPGPHLFQDVGDVRCMAALALGDGRVHLAVGGTRYQTLHATGGGSLVRMYEAADGERTNGFSAEGRPDALAALPRPRSGPLLAVAVGTAIKLWDPSTRVLTSAWTGDRVAAMTALAVPGGRHILAMASATGTIRLWDPGSGSTVATLPTGVPVSAMAAVNGYLAIGGAAGMVIFQLDGLDGLAC